MTDLFGVAINEGTINNIILQAYQQLEATEHAGFRADGICLGPPM